MLNPSNEEDRLDYSRDLLIPPDDDEYKLDFAIGTTYSLDFDALICASIALGLGKEADDSLRQDHIYILNALKTVGDKVAIFHENGQIHPPKQPTPLYALLEKMVFPVTIPSNGGGSSCPSFHPKFWLIRYKAPGNVNKYRVAVLSRNLTFDRSWDVAFRMDGRVVGSRTRDNGPIGDFLNYLTEWLPDDESGSKKAKKIQEIIADLPCVRFDLEDGIFEGFEFLPSIPGGVDGLGNLADSPLFQHPFHEAVIISPFISKRVIKGFNDRCRHPAEGERPCVLITREVELRRLKPADVRNFQLYKVNEDIKNGEIDCGVDEGAACRQDIHAKVYMLRKNKSSDTDLYLGSLNASENGVHNNVEFMIRLWTKKRYLDLHKLMAELRGNEENEAFVEVPLQDAVMEDDGEKRQALDKVIRAISRGEHSATIVPKNGDYVAEVHFSLCDLGGFTVTVRLLSRNDGQALAENVRFGGLQLSELTEWYAVSVSDGEWTVERVLKIPTTGIPEEERDGVIVRAIVSDRDCLYRCLSLCLGEDAPQRTWERDTAPAGSPGTANRRTALRPAIYEMMLRAAANNPGKLKDIDWLAEAMAEFGTDELRQLFAVFKKAVAADG